MDIVYQTAVVVKLPLERVFRDAFDYFEERHAKKWVMEQFIKYKQCEILHPTVQNYCIEILSGRQKC